MIVALRDAMAWTLRQDDTDPRPDGISDPAELINIAVGALLLVLLLVAGFSMVRQWSVDGLTTTQVATVHE
jgi:hypothetical protein